jgi:hypothetical protein
MKRLDVGVFADKSSKLHARVARRLNEVLAEFTRRWPDVTVRRRHYVGPDALLDYIVVAGELAHSQANTEATRSVSVAGCGQDAEHAVATFGGELAERAALLWCTRRAEVVDSLRGLADRGESVFDIETFVGRALGGEAWAHSPFSPSDRIGWITARAVTSGRLTLVPLFLVASTRSERTPFGRSTIGTAAANGLVAATHRALDELCERHILRVAWFLGQHPVEVQPPASWSAKEDGRASWKTRFFELRLRHDDTPLALVFSRHVSESLFAIGSAFEETWADAVAHATREAIQGRLAAWLYRNEPQPNSVVTYLDHMRWFSTPDRLTLLEQFFSGTERLSAWRRDAISAASEDLRQARDTACSVPLLHETDLAVVRVLSPTLQPMEACHAEARLVGRWQRSLPREALARAPHPFG